MEATIQFLRSNNVYVQNIRSIYENDEIFENVENPLVFFIHISHRRGCVTWLVLCHVIVIVDSRSKSHTVELSRISGAVPRRREVARWDLSPMSNISVSWQNLIFQDDSRFSFLGHKNQKSNFPWIRFASNLEIIPHDIRWLDPVLVSLHLVGYSKSYRWTKIFKNLRSAEKVCQTLVCSSRMNFTIWYTSIELSNTGLSSSNIICETTHNQSLIDNDSIFWKIQNFENFERFSKNPKF